MIKLAQLPAWTDNYIYILYDEARGDAVVVDPTEAAPVKAFLAQKKLNLLAIINTHHHPDHIGGNLELRKETGCPIYGYKGDASRIPGITNPLDEGDAFTLLGQHIKVMFVPGHTTGHIAYYFARLGWIFSGDVIFAMGCGKLFEGTPLQLLTSMEKICELPQDTWICCTHEYTLANSKFALAVDPHNPRLSARIEQEKRRRDKGEPTVPTTVALEKSTNPFLRCDSIEIQKTLGMLGADKLEVFTALRKMKDKF